MTSGNLSEFDALDIEPLIAARPAEPRDSSRLIIADRAAATITHRFFRDLPEFLTAGDTLVLNRSRVWKAKLPAEKTTGGKSELLLIRAENKELTRWSALARKMQPGQILICKGAARAECLQQNSDGSFLFELSEPLSDLYLQTHAEVPLPQYILKARKKASDGGQVSPDEARYQTVFASEPGSIAAPTAGFHFTPELIDKLRAKGVGVVFISLHIGWGTFKPVRTDDPATHVMLPETCELSPQAAAELNSARARGSRIIAVGTSSMRTLETLSDSGGILSPGRAEASLFIYPGYHFKTPGAFLTNLHVPSSAPLYMTAAFAGQEFLFKAYKEAVEKKYRFYSYGDSMLVL